MSTQPSSQMDRLLERAKQTKRTHPADRAGESISAMEMWRLVYANMSVISKSMPDAPPDIQRALAEAKTFEDCSRPDSIKTPLKQPKVESNAVLDDQQDSDKKPKVNVTPINHEQTNETSPDQVHPARRIQMRLPELDTAASPPADQLLSASAETSSKVNEQRTASTPSHKSEVSVTLSISSPASHMSDRDTVRPSRRERAELHNEQNYSLMSSHQQDNQGPTKSPGLTLVSRPETSPVPMRSTFPDLSVKEFPKDGVLFEASNAYAALLGPGRENVVLVSTSMRGQPPLRQYQSDANAVMRGLRQYHLMDRAGVEIRMPLGIFHRENRSFFKPGMLADEDARRNTENQSSSCRQSRTSEKHQGDSAHERRRSRSPLAQREQKHRSDRPRRSPSPFRSSQREIRHGRLNEDHIHDGSLDSRKRSTSRNFKRELEEGELDS
ncbi:uncharacterized protein LY89DRAFT_738877 [Mollisia scopiformis]|uniref:Uncharacterized protein n=1 Tax=Mollisia scopiformis TaxID=149040 RepID=A0A194WU09_MOLSC|nr:uncharacterized protein LY89DRAFT_738877 [Mollisia scopiformis]KUJ11440.1 hypothetical protein LY89DRAFT_738877 [Mollisia scopiformis]